MKIVWSPSALQDLIHLRTYIAELRPQMAKTIGQKIIRFVEKLLRFPALGRPGRIPGTRELLISGTPFVIPYRVTSTCIEIIAVLHHAQKWPD